MVPEPKHVSIHTEKNIEYPDSLERRMRADRKEKENDPLCSPIKISQEEKPVVPVRFVTPKLVRVNRGTLKRSAHRLKRPRRPAPPPPAGVEPYRTLAKQSLPQRKRKRPPPPKRTSPSKTYLSQPPPPPQRKIVPKLMMPKSASSNMSSTTSPLQSAGDESASKPGRHAPSRPAPPAPSAVLEARKQSIASVASTGSFIPPPPMFMDTIQKEKESAKPRQVTPPKPAKRTSIQLKKLENDVENTSAHNASESSMNSLDRYASIDSKDSGSSWGQGSSLDKKDRPVMAVKPVMKFVQGDAWKQDIKRTSTNVPHNSNVANTSPDGHSPPTSHATSFSPVSAKTMRVVPQPQSEQLKSKPKMRPNPPPRKSVSQSIIPLQEIQPHIHSRGQQDSRPSTSSTDSSKPVPPRPPPPRPAGPPPQYSGVVMRKKNR